MSVVLLLACTPTVADRLETLEQDGFSGVVRVVSGDHVLADEAMGLAVREEGVPNQLDTVFTVGSITKQFTGALAVHADEQGWLGLQDTLGQHLDGVPADKADITVHQLLTHQAGFGIASGHDTEVIDREAWVQGALDSELLFSPGAEFAYSNIGYGLVAALLEQTTGRDYETLLREELLLPHGLEQTGYDDPDYAGTVAHGYFGEDVWGAPLTASFEQGPYWHLTGNGGVLSTLDDMEAWTRALVAGQVVETDALFARHVQIPDGAYGYGWGIESWREGDNINHNGGNGYFYAMVVWWPQDELLVLAMSNDASRHQENVGWQLSESALRHGR